MVRYFQKPIVYCINIWVDSWWIFSQLHLLKLLSLFFLFENLCHDTTDFIYCTGKFWKDLSFVIEVHNLFNIYIWRNNSFFRFFDSFNLLELSFNLFFLVQWRQILLILWDWLLLLLYLFINIDRRNFHLHLRIFFWLISIHMLMSFWNIHKFIWFKFLFLLQFLFGLYRSLDLLKLKYFSFSLCKIAITETFSILFRNRFCFSL